MTPRFSERVGAVKFEIQLGSMNDALKNSIWNVVSELITNERPVEYAAVRAIAADVLRVPREEVAAGYPRTWLLEFCKMSQLDWAGWYDLLEYAVENALTFSRRVSPQAAQHNANLVLEREHSAYRFVGGRLTAITTPAEIAEVEGAIKRASASGLEGVRAQIEQALALFGKRPEPDYRNAIKEAISAVEGVVKLISGTRGGGLHGALEAISEHLDLHPALKAGLEKLYGYTSDEDGIRHPILDEPNVGEADARFMIVACSAFVNFLVGKAEAAGLLKRG